MAELQQDRTGGEPPRRRPRRDEPARAGHIAVGYTDRADLDGFIGGEAGNLVVHGPIHTGDRIYEAATLGPGVTEGTPCLVVPLVHERIDEIQEEVSDLLARFRSAEPGALPEARRGGGAGGRPRTIEETGGTARGTSSGAIREGADGRRGR